MQCIEPCMNMNQVLDYFHVIELHIYAMQINVAAAIFVSSPSGDSPLKSLHRSHLVHFRPLRNPLATI